MFLPEHLHKKLEDRIKKHPKIRIIRSFKRQGKDSMRILGAVAKGPILLSVGFYIQKKLKTNQFFIYFEDRQPHESLARMVGTTFRSFQLRHERPCFPSDVFH